MRQIDQIGAPQVITKEGLKAAQIGGSARVPPGPSCDAA